MYIQTQSPSLKITCLCPLFTLDSRPLSQREGAAKKKKQIEKKQRGRNGWRKEKTDKEKKRKNSGEKEKKKEE